MVVMNMPCIAVLISGLLCTAPHAQAGNTNTSDDVLSPFTVRIIDEWVAAQPDPHWHLFDWIKYESGRNGQENLVRFFGPMTLFDNTKATLGTKHRGGQDRAESKGEEWFANTIGDTFIDAFTSWYDFDRLKRPENSAVNFGVKFVQGTLNTDEGKLEPDSLAPDSVTINENWVESFIHSDQTKYGINPLNANPYWYFAHAFGRRHNGLPLFITDTRVRMMFLSSRVGSIRGDQGVTIPFDRYTLVTVGYRFYFTETMGNDTSPSLTVRMTHILDQSGGDVNLLYGSAQINEQEQQVLIGFSCDDPFKTLRRIFRR